MLSRGLRERLAVNREAAGLDAFAAMLLAVLEDPQVAESVADAVRPAPRKPARPVVSSAAAARDLKSARLAAGRSQHRG